MDEKQNFTEDERPARIELDTPKFMEILIKMTKVVVSPKSMGLFSPDSVHKAAEILLVGLIEELKQRLAEDDFRAFYVTEFILSTDLYKLTNLEMLEESIKNQKKERGTKLVLPEHYTKQ